MARSAGEVPPGAPSRLIPPVSVAQDRPTAPCMGAFSHQAALRPFGLLPVVRITAHSRYQKSLPIRSVSGGDRAPDFVFQRQAGTHRTFFGVPEKVLDHYTLLLATYSF